MDNRAVPHKEVFMTSVNWERWARATGIGFVVLFVVAYVTYGDQPGVGSSAEEVVAFYDGDRGRILTAGFILGVAALFLLWFAGAVANALREAGEGRLAATTLGTATALVGVVLVLDGIGVALAHSIAATGDAGVVQALNDVSWAFNVIASFPAAGFIAAATIGLWRTGLVADWFGWIGLAAAAVVLIGGTTWARDGFWAPDGGYTTITVIVAVAWVLVASVLLYMQSPVGERAPET
ncbi:MAG: hypothetical protein ACRDKU_08805, partial [Gaiellaceae bacterium]